MFIFEQMASNPPVRLDAYCKTFNVDFFDLQIPCIFCKHYLNLQELAAFHMKRLSLAWRDSICYACCTGCIRLSAKLEIEKYYRCSCSSDTLEFLLEVPLTEITVRCLDCYALLDTAEKFDCKARSEYLHLVRHVWRGYCRICAKK